MKKIESSAVDQSAKTTSGNMEESCPCCGSRSWCFQDGVVFCNQHGYFEPEPTDTRLWAMRQSFLASKKSATGGSQGGGGTGGHYNLDLTADCTSDGIQRSFESGLPAVDLRADCPSDAIQRAYA